MRFGLYRKTRNECYGDKRHTQRAFNSEYFVHAFPAYTLSTFNFQGIVWKHLRVQYLDGIIYTVT